MLAVHIKSLLYQYSKDQRRIALNLGEEGSPRYTNTSRHRFQTWIGPSVTRDLALSAIHNPGNTLLVFWRASLNGRKLEYVEIGGLYHCWLWSGYYFRVQEGFEPQTYLEAKRHINLPNLLGMNAVDGPIRKFHFPVVLSFHFLVCLRSLVQDFGGSHALVQY